MLEKCHEIRIEIFRKRNRFPGKITATKKNVIKKEGKRMKRDGHEENNEQKEQHSGPLGIWNIYKTDFL